MPLLVGLEPLSRGKVRDSYLLANGKILQVATDAISIFDIILNAVVPLKGAILTAMTVFWCKLLESYGIRTHLVAYGAGIDKYLPSHLRGHAGLQSRALVVEKLNMANDVEFIVRAVLTGSGKEAYDKTGQVCGHVLPAGLQDGDSLPFLLDTPTTKAQEGHDEHISSADIRKKYPQQTLLALRIFEIARMYAGVHGILLADTKFEFGVDKDGNVVLGDEVLTPDSSRFVDLPEWQASRRVESGRKMPSSRDKQMVRAWGITAGIKNLDPTNPDDVDKAHQLVVPDDIIKRTTEIYRYIFWRLTGETLEHFQREVMGINAQSPKKRVLFVCGSESDLPKIKTVLELHRPQNSAIHVMSCHRNPWDVMRLCETRELLDYDVVIGVGGMALALPGIIDAWASYFGRDVRVAGVALGEPRSLQLLAAQLSITQLPGQPVIFDEIAGEAYTGSEGLAELLDRIESGELPPAPTRKEKPVQRNVQG